jgi:PAS domain S-box-containing protein
MITAVSARLEDMFGYGPGELAGLPAESLVPQGLREAHRGHRAAWGQSPSARPMGAGMQLAGVRKDGTTFPVRVSPTPVAARSGQFTLAVIRDITGTGRLDDLAALAWDTAAARREHLELLDAVITGLFAAGLGLHAAEGLPSEAARERTGQVAGELEGIIRQSAPPRSPSPTGSARRPASPAMTGNAAQGRRSAARCSARTPAVSVPAQRPPALVPGRADHRAGGLRSPARHSLTGSPLPGSAAPYLRPRASGAAARRRPRSGRGSLTG